MKIILLLLLSVISFITEAQTPYSFFVFSIKGSGYYNRDKYRIPIKIGTPLSENDDLILLPGSEVKIICNNYTLFTITSNDIHPIPISNYTDSCKAENSSSTMQFLKFVWNHLKAEDADVANNKNDYLNEYGAVSRGCPDSIFSDLPDTILLYKKPLQIKYTPVDSSAKYKLKIFENSTNKFPVITVNLIHNYFYLSISLITKLSNETNYYYSFTRNGQEFCERKLLKKLNDRSMNLLLQSIEKSEGFEKLSLNNKRFTIAYFYEKHHLPTEAYVYYKELFRASQNDSLIREEKMNLERFFGFE